MCDIELKNIIRCDPTNIELITLFLESREVSKFEITNALGVVDINNHEILYLLLKYGADSNYSIISDLYNKSLIYVLAQYIYEPRKYPTFEDHRKYVVCSFMDKSSANIQIYTKLLQLACDNVNNVTEFNIIFNDYCLVFTRVVDLYDKINNICNQVINLLQLQDINDEIRINILNIIIFGFIKLKTHEMIFAEKKLIFNHFNLKLFTDNPNNREIRDKNFLEKNNDGIDEMIISLSKYFLNIEIDVLKNNIINIFKNELFYKYFYYHHQSFKDFFAENHFNNDIKCIQKYINNADLVLVPIYRVLLNSANISAFEQTFRMFKNSAMKSLSIFIRLLLISSERGIDDFFLTYYKRFMNNNFININKLIPHCIKIIKQQITFQTNLRLLIQLPITKCAPYIYYDKIILFSYLINKSDILCYNKDILKYIVKIFVEI